jgi:ubiquinone/menaquinone biosynthesis C-methylase UbiE
MRIIFDEQVAGRYDAWYLAPGGRYAERVENQLMLEMIRPRPGQTLLDVGCGTGNHLLLFHRMGLDVAGIEPSEPMLRGAQDKLGSKADLRLGVAEDLPYEDNSFDIVTLVTSLEFCSHPFRALSEAFRVARGQVFVGVLNWLSINGIHRKVEGMFRPNIYRHARFYSVWELRYMVRRVLGVCRMEWGSVLLFPPSLHRWDRIAAHCVPKRRNPLGAFLGMRVEILYTHQTAMNPLIPRWATMPRPETSHGIWRA